MTVSKVCALCGRRYVGHGLSRYCSDMCRAKADAAHHRTPEYVARRRERRRAEAEADAADAKAAVSGLTARQRHDLRMLFAPRWGVEDVFVEEWEEE